MWPFKKQAEVEKEAARRVAAAAKPTPSLEDWAKDSGREDTQVVATAVQTCHNSIRESAKNLTSTTKSLREIAAIPLQARRA